MTSRLLGACLALVIAWTPTVTLAGEDTKEDEARWEADEFADDLIHSRLPIYGYEWEEFWPQPISGEDSWGCGSINIGDWKFEPDPADKTTEAYWMRFKLGGAFTCGLRVFEADEQSQLDNGQSNLGFFARIGAGTISGKPVELWVLQRGARPGSGYLLLAKESVEVGGGEYLVLQRRCPADRYLSVDNLDSWSTGYCAIDTHDELLALSREMLKLPPLGTLKMQEGPDAEAPDPSNSQSSD